MNLNESNPEDEQLIRDALERESTEPIATAKELEELAEDIVRHCPSLTHLLLALYAKPSEPDVLHGLN
jgi:hypothetical protein